MPGKNGRQAWREAVSGCGGGCVNMKAPKTDTQLMSFLKTANYYRAFIKRYADKVYPMQQLMRNKGKKFEWNERAQDAFENIKRNLCEAPVVGMPTAFVLSALMLQW